MSWISEEARAEHTDGLATLFGRASNGCFCRWWHFSGDDYAWQARCNLEPDLNRAEQVEAVAASRDDATGIVALDASTAELVGWLKLCPAPVIPKLYGRRVYRSLSCFDGDRSSVLVVGCMLVAPELRRRGVATVLIRGALDAARRRGARAVEALPRHSSEPLRDDELWTGPVSTFLAAGFVRVDGPDPYPVLRHELAP
jgi:GNAT superfamily N-acetyltransferase